MTSPAQVSGPGPYSKRTDAGGQPIRALPDPKYGEAQQFEQTQKAAPLAQAPGAPAAAAPRGAAPGVSKGIPPKPMPGLFDPGDPSIPVTSGAPLGPGPNQVTGPGMPAPQRRTSEQLAEYANGDEALTFLVNVLAQRGQ